MVKSTKTAFATINPSPSPKNAPRRPKSATASTTIAMAKSTKTAFATINPSPSPKNASRRPKSATASTTIATAWSTKAAFATINPKNASRRPKSATASITIATAWSTMAAFATNSSDVTRAIRSAISKSPKSRTKSTKKVVRRRQTDAQQDLGLGYSDWAC